MLSSPFSCASWSSYRLRNFSLKARSSSQHLHLQSLKWASLIPVICPNSSLWYDTHWNSSPFVMCALLSIYFTFSRCPSIHRALHFTQKKRSGLPIAHFSCTSILPHLGQDSPIYFTVSAFYVVLGFRVFRIPHNNLYRIHLTN
jgi:hypothetical protein